MFAVQLNGQWMAWGDALAKPLHRRSAWRLGHDIIGILLAHGLWAIVSSWWRAAGIGEKFRSYYYFLDSIGRKATAVDAVVFALLHEQIDVAEERCLLAIDDTPTQRYGPKVQGAGIHHNPTPGPAGSTFLYGHSWVVLSRVAHHPQSGTIGLPVSGRLYIRRKDIPDLPPTIDWTFQTKPKIAAEMITWAGAMVSGQGRRPWVAVDRGYANREFIKPAKRRLRGGRPIASRRGVVRPPARAQAGRASRSGSPADLRQESPELGQARANFGAGRPSRLRPRRARS